MKSDSSLNTTRMRCMIGWLGMALPWLVCLILWLIPDSISATYYTNAQAVFMIVLGSASFLLFSYKGYDRWDDLINCLAAVGGLMVCLFPCAVSDTHGIQGTFAFLSMGTSNTLHCIGAVIFFGMLSIDSLFRFTKTSGEMTPNKKKRNVIYRVCGIGMLITFALLPIAMSGIIHWNSIVWFVEMVALLFFGISFLTKANRYTWLFADDPQDVFAMIFSGSKKK